jgi:aspartate/methionine/tyrosine aminotransferase
MIRTIPTGRDLSGSHGAARLINIAEQHGLVILADEVYGDLGYDGTVPPMAAPQTTPPIISYSSLSEGYLAPGWRAGLDGRGIVAASSIRRSPRTRARRRPPVQSRADAVRGDRGAHRRSLAPDRFRKRCARAPS